MRKIEAWWRDSSIYIHYQSWFFFFSQSFTEEAPVSFWKSFLWAPLLLFFHPSMTAALEWPHQQVFTVKSKISLPANGKGNPARRPNRVHEWEDDLAGWTRAPPADNQQVFDTVTSHLACVDVQLFLEPWLQTNCLSGGFAKETSALSTQGLKLIWQGMSTLGKKQRTSAFSGMAPFVAILGLISICKRDNCSHMEAIDRRGQCNFFQRADGARRISAGIRRNKNLPFRCQPITTTHHFQSHTNHSNYPWSDLLGWCCWLIHVHAVPGNTLSVIDK